MQTTGMSIISGKNDYVAPFRFSPFPLPIKEVKDWRILKLKRVQLSFDVVFTGAGRAGAIFWHGNQHAHAQRKSISNLCIYYEQIVFGMEL